MMQTKKLIIYSAKFYCDSSGWCVFNSFCCLLSFFQIFLCFIWRTTTICLDVRYIMHFLFQFWCITSQFFLFSSLYVALGKLIIIVSYQVLSLYFFSGTCFECVVWICIIQNLYLYTLNVLYTIFSSMRV